MSVTLTTLRARVRERADMVGSSFVADAATGLDAWIHEGWQQLYGKLIDAMGDEYVESKAALSLTAGVSDYALPSDFFKLYGIDLPDTVLKKIYYQNALRITKGLPQSGWPR